MNQIDYLLEASAAEITMDSTLLAAIEKRLPQTPTLSVLDVSLAIPVSRDVVYAWIDTGCVKTLDATGQRAQRKRYNRIGRDDLLTFLKTRIK